LRGEGGDAGQAGGGDDRDEGLFDPAAAFQQPVREAAAGPEAGDGELDRAGPGAPRAGAAAVAVVDACVADPAVLGVAQGVGLSRT
jgi:hypothetical protein